MSRISAPSVSLIVILGVLILTAAAVSADGRYDDAIPTIVEVSEPSNSCYKSQAASTASSPGCHMINWTSQGNSVDINLTFSPLGVMKHPGSDRSPASLFPGWVHRVHGESNWPRWAGDGAPGNNNPSLSGLNLITSPPAGVLLAGNADSSIGSGTSFPFRRVFDELNCPDDLRLNYENAIGNASILLYPWGNPTGPQTSSSTCNVASNDRVSPQPQGCSAGGTTYFGCHGTEGVATTYTRIDSPSCSQCHFELTGNVTSTNSKHGVATGANQCVDCHNASASATGDQLNSSFGVPEVKNCWECHEGTTIGPTVNTTGMHAGKDCRFCHGHGHNITRDTSWNMTCGNTDDICHSTNTAPPRNIGGDSTFRHGGTTNNVTCGGCHIPSSSTAHNITVPSCRKCHNSTGTGNASTGSSSLYGDTGDTRSNTTPNWDRSTNSIYHDGSRGSIGGMNCTFCHVPDISPTQGNLDKVHYINSTQNTTTSSNVVPDCRDSRCHGSGGAGAYIQYSHGEAVVNASNWGRSLTCTMCHNNASLYMFSQSGNYTLGINTYLHTSGNSGYNITPFNSSRSPSGKGSSGEITDNQVCLNCHSGTTGVSGDCSSCHLNDTGTTGTLIIHDDDMGVASQLQLDGNMEAGGGPNCLAGCHDVGGSGSAHVNLSIMSQPNYAHYMLNNRSGDPGLTETTDDWNNRRCWACHSNGTAVGASAGAEAMGLNRTTPYLCPDCHTPSGSQYGKYNLTFMPTVFEHFVNGTDISTKNVTIAGDFTNNRTDQIAGSCVRCHNTIRQR